METIWPQHFQPDVVREGFGGKLTSYAITLEAWRRGLAVTYTSPHIGTYRITDQSGRSLEFLRSRPNLTTDQAVDTVNDKHKTIQHLKQVGVPTPQSRLIDLTTTGPHELKKLAQELGYPLVLKPLRGSMGKGVFAGIRTPDELLRRFEDLLPLTRGHYAVLESHMDGDDYRVLVVGDRFAGACKRIPANVVGDGISSVRQLIELKNSQRKENPFLSKGPIQVDPEVHDYLASQNHHVESVPSEGEFVRLRSAANASAGGDVIDVSVDLPEAIKRAAVEAVQAIPGLFCAGVDVLYSPGLNENEPSYCIIELNAHPQIGVNMYPTHGEGQDVPNVFLDACFPESARYESAGDTQLSLSLEDLLWPIRTGVAAEVTLKPIPSHRYAVRKLFSFTPSRSLARIQKNRLRRTARNHDIAGFYRTADEKGQLMIAGSADGVREYMKVASTILAAPLTDEQDWEGPVSGGFHVQ